MTVHERINKPGENTAAAFPYLKEVATTASARSIRRPFRRSSRASMAGPGGNKMNEEQIKKLIEQLKKAGRRRGA